MKAKLLHYDSPGFTGLTRLVAAATYLVRRYGLRFLSLVTACTARRYGPNWPKQIARVRLSVSLPFILSAREGRSLLHWAYLPPVTAGYARSSSPCLLSPQPATRSVSPETNSGCRWTRLFPDEGNARKLFNPGGNFSLRLPQQFDLGCAQRSWCFVSRSPQSL